MGGLPVLHESTMHYVLLQDQVCKLEFCNSGWLNYFLKLTEYNEDVAREFICTFSDGEAGVKGLRVITIGELIVKVMGLPTDREKYPKTKDARSARVEFTQPDDSPLVKDKQGTRRESLPPKWKAKTLYIMKYLTCEGRYSCLHSHHFKLPSHLCHRRRMNVPNILYNLLSISAKKTQKGRPHSVTHHCLIKLLVKRPLRDIS